MVREDQYSRHIHLACLESNKGVFIKAGWNSLRGWTVSRIKVCNCSVNVATYVVFQLSFVCVCTCVWVCVCVYLCWLGAWQSFSEDSRNSWQSWVQMWAGSVCTPLVLCIPTLAEQPYMEDTLGTDSSSIPLGRGGAPQYLYFGVVLMNTFNSGLCAWSLYYYLLWSC